jgi:hypothetical protein
MALGAVAAAAVVFYLAQNTLRPVGGEIAPSKLSWLSGAILLWGVLPWLLLADARLGMPLRRAYAVLAGLMLARAAVEGWMLYVTLNWSPWYGIAHDAACMAALLGLAARIAPARALERLAWRHLYVSAAFFAPEIYFAGYMLANFDTQGAAAIYFVPGHPDHAIVLWITTATVVCLAAYLAVFLHRWIPGSENEHA